MEYEVKKKQILAQVEYTNLLSFSLVENKLQRNFRSIVDALMLNQAKTDALNNDHIQVKEQNQKQISKLNELMKQMKQQLENLQNQQKNTESYVPPHSAVKLHSIKQMERLPSRKTLQRVSTPSEDNLHLKSLVDNLNQKMNGWQNKWDDEKADLMRQISNMKDKLDEVGFFENQLKNLKSDLRNIKDQVSLGLKNNNTTSNKTLTKRSSLLNLMNNKVSDKIIQQPSKHSIKVLSKDDNKENTPTILNDNADQENQLSSINQMIQKQINSLYLEINTMKISFEQLKDLVSDNRKQIFKSNNLVSEVKDDLARQVKTRKGQTQDLQKAIKDIKMQMLNVSNVSKIPQTQPQEKGTQQSARTAKGGKRDDDDVNYKNQLHDKISRMQAMIQNLITQSEFNRLKNDLNDQLQRLSAKIQSVDQNLENTEKKLQDLIVQNQVNTNSELDDLKNRMNLSQETAKSQANQNERKNNIMNAKIQEVKKSLQNLREDLQFYQSMMAQNNKNSPKQDIQLQEITSQINENDKQKGTGVDEKALETLKKYFSGKMHDLRTNLLGLIRDLQKKMNNKSSGDQQVVKIWDRLNEVNLFMNKKADQDDAKKTFLYLQKKINRLNSVLFKNQDNTQDARIARTNQWSCLSCDKNLNTYQGKIGKHMVWDTMPLKGINKSVLIQPQDKKKGLPQLKK